MSTPCAIDAGDTTWVLISTILVLNMMPALALFESGLLRSKNSLSIASQVISGLTILSFLWNIVGYSLVFGKDYGFIGGLENSFLLGISYKDCSPNHAINIPSALFALFQMMFATISPLLLTGAYAERLKFKSFIMITILWEVLIYYPVAHWIWGGGFLQQMGVLDFAGGIVIHTTAGTSALVLAMMVGQRKDFDKYNGEFPPSNIPMAFIGAGLLWLGWFGFNAGSALSAGPFAVSAVMSTQIGASTSGMIWLVLSWKKGHPSCVALMNGVIAGLAGITPASGYINNQMSMLLGLILGVASFYSAHFVKGKLRIDDALDVSSVHGLTGIIGSLFIGFGASGDIYPVKNEGIFYGGHGKLLGYQTLAVFIAIAYSAVITYFIGKLTEFTLGLRITEEEENEGLDIAEHNEFAYHNLMLTGHEKYDDDDKYFEVITSASGINSDVPLILRQTRN